MRFCYWGPVGARVWQWQRVSHVERLRLVWAQLALGQTEAIHHRAQYRGVLEIR